MSEKTEKPTPRRLREAQKKGQLARSRMFSAAVVTLGGFAATEVMALQVAGWVGGAMATGLAVGAPIAAASLAVDLLLGMAARAAPSLNLSESGAPLRILGGGALLWMGVGVLSDRLLQGVFGSEALLRQLSWVAR